MNNKLATIAAAVLFFSSSIAAEAALIYGSEVFTGLSSCPSYCTGGSGGSILGGEGAVSTGVSAASDYRGSAKASAALSGGYSTPILKAEAYANSHQDNYVGSAFAYGIQGYTYSGVGETLTLNVNLDGFVTDPMSNSLQTKVLMQVVLYETHPFAFTYDRATLEAEYGATPLKQTDGSNAVLILQLDYNNPASASGQISVDVATGDEFYLFASMHARSQAGTSGDAIADAFNTGTMGFQGSPNLTAASSVPVPAAIWLFGSGILALIGFRRKG